MKHLTSAELLRVRDGLPSALGEARPRSLRDLRKHVESCLQCTQALLDLYAARQAFARRAETGAEGSTSAPAAAASESLRDTLRERAVPPPAASPGSELSSGRFSIARWLIVGLVAVAALIAAWRLQNLERSAPLPAAPPPVMVDTAT